MASNLFNRTKQCFRMVRKRNRTIVPPETYNTKECCNPMLVLAKVGSKDSWKNDITGAWWKPLETTDYVDFTLHKKGDALAIYQPVKIDFPNDTAYGVKIDWQTALQLDGAGCYYLKLTYNEQGGDPKTLIWGEYMLKEYSEQTAKSTIRVKVSINQYFSIDDINFKDSGIIDCLRFEGFFGNMTPNFKIDNLIYENRKFENVQRERIATYEMLTNPLMYKLTDFLINVHLLAENRIWISDYNSFNHSWFYKDKELTVNSSPEIEYFEFSRLAKIKCEFTDKTRDNLAKYA